MRRNFPKIESERERERETEKEKERETLVSDREERRLFDEVWRHDGRIRARVESLDRVHHGERRDQGLRQLQLKPARGRCRQKWRVRARTSLHRPKGGALWCWIAFSKRLCVVLEELEERRGVRLRGLERVVREPARRRVRSVVQNQ